MSKKLRPGMKTTLTDGNGDVATFTLLKAAKAKYKTKFIIENVNYKGINFVRTLTMGNKKYKESIRLSETKNPDVDLSVKGDGLEKLRTIVKDLQKLTQKLKGPIAEY